jgi:hypothetical protein
MDEECPLFLFDLLLAEKCPSFIDFHSSAGGIP